MLLDIEKVSVINSTLKGAQGLYGVNALDFEDGAFDMLAKLSVEAAVDVVERIVQSKRGAKKATVTKQQMQSHVGCLDNGIGAIGFGRNE
ncbi:MAG: hypothetical protein K2M36_05335, partial [Clostridia bacterium]|nr:hypothetical protein [Clostridia bacterium]